MGCLTWYAAFVIRYLASGIPLRYITRMTHTVKLAPSILAADFTRLGEQVLLAEQAGADRIHIDVMDGHFVPNISIGPLIVKALRPVTRLPLEAHLMIEQPDRYLEAFAAAGADCIIVHCEASVHLHRSIQHVKALGKQAGVAINPATPLVALEEILTDLHLVLVMTVNPGFGGQQFMASVLPKIRRLRELLQKSNRQCELEVDGGIDAVNAPQVVAAGADVLVAGTSVFGASDGVAAAMARLAAAAR